MRSFGIDSLRGQIIIIPVCALLVTLGLVSFLLALSRPPLPPPPPDPWPSALQIKTVIQALHAVMPADRLRVARAVSSPELSLRPEGDAPCPTGPENFKVRELALVLTDMLGTEFGPLDVRSCANGPTVEVDVPSEGTFLDIRMIGRTHARPLLGSLMPLIVPGSFLLTVTAALSLWAFWRVSHPLRQLAGTVEQFGRDVTVAPLPVRGSIEIRQVAQAFNRMQERVARNVDERRRMLMTIGHDLRTPLTRMKLRLDMDEAGVNVKALSRDLDLMQKMIDGALAFLRDEGEHEPLAPVDLGALVETICIEFAEAGHEVAYVGGYGPECRCQATAIERAVTNLLENACRYASHATGSVRRDGNTAVIEIRDDGPGIPAPLRQAMLLPFARLDAARPTDGRLGLGLSIVADIARRHGGHLHLADAEPVGLLVRLTLPLEAEAAESLGA